MKREVLTDDYTRDVCKIGQGAACCRYLTMSGAGWGCEKHAPLAELIDQRVLLGQFTASGDNCPGVDEPSTLN